MSINANKLYNTNMFLIENRSGLDGWCLLDWMRHMMLAQSSWLGPYIHNGKKPINPLDSHVKFSQLGVEICFLEHIGQIYNKYIFDQHGLKLGDRQRTNKQNWASIQKICQRKVQNCLNMLQTNGDIHHESMLGTKLYLEICVDYIEIFMSLILDLQSRIILAFKVSFSSTFGDYGWTMETI